MLKEESMTQHIVKSYDEDLNTLSARILDMGELVKTCLEQAVETVVHQKEDLARKVIATDPTINQMERDIDAFAVRMLALRRPVARDLRNVVAGLKISSDLERLGDYAANISRRSFELKGTNIPGAVKALPRLMKQVGIMLDEVMQAYCTLDHEKAYKVWAMDAEVDNLYNSFLRELLTYMIEDPRSIGTGTQLLFIAKNIERAGDHVTNIAEMVHYVVFGTSFRPPAPEETKK